LTSAKRWSDVAVLVAFQTSPRDDAQGADEVVASIDELSEVLLGHIR
jgi:hypothetical protein